MAEIAAWMRDIDPEMLPEPWRELAKALGVDVVLELVARFGGTTLYVPKLDRLLVALRDQRIVEGFDGGNYRELALRFNLTETHVRRIINEHLKQRLAQARLFN